MGLSPQDCLRKLDQIARLAQRRLELLTANIEQAVVRLVLEAQQAPKRGRCLIPAGFDLREERGRFTMILAACSPAERCAAGCVTGSYPSEYGKRGRCACVVDVLAFFGDQLRYLHEASRVAQPRRRIGLRARLDLCRVPRGQLDSSSVAMSSP